ncbi:hypothetical protein SELMODRAFT_403158 [Selaginella moellendorffii]|uniref:Pentacotripeptide-repeat region of PRORP domain-containing protein n=1 Tax=Selaginella moellendorffii TaxID=88036 RepID=D8QP86_SELML|nr:hypothetical protein SELMODRAFT_403158 [Selaginella moellendorffii]
MDLEAREPPDKVTFVTMLDVCGNLKNSAAGEEIDAAVTSSGLWQDVTVGNALVCMHGRCGRMELARSLFERMEHRDGVLWTTMVAAYAQNNLLDQARATFDAMPDKLSLVAPWNAMISAYVRCGENSSGVMLFLLMDLEGGRANEITLDARYHFVAMAGDYGIAASLDHYICMVDVLGRSGKVAEAGELVGVMPFVPDAVAWKTLLGCSKVHENAGLARWAAEKLARIDAKNPSSYLLLSSAVTKVGKS